MNWFEDEVGIKSQSRSSYRYVGIINGEQAPDSMNGLSVIISGYFRFCDLEFMCSICSAGRTSNGS